MRQGDELASAPAYMPKGSYWYDNDNKKVSKMQHVNNTLSWSPFLLVYSGGEYVGYRLMGKFQFFRKLCYVLNRRQGRARRRATGTAYCRDSSVHPYLSSDTFLVIV
jgi:hypothetical protein